MTVSFRPSGALISSSSKRAYGLAARLASACPRSPTPKLLYENPTLAGLSTPRFRNERVEVGCKIVRVGIVWIGGMNVVGHPRQARVMCNQIEQCDLPALWFRHRARGQQLTYRRIKLDFPVLNHLRQDQTGEGLGNGADLECRVRSCRTVCEHAAHTVAHHADSHSRRRLRRERAASPYLLQIAIQNGLHTFGVHRRKHGIECHGRLDAPPSVAICSRSFVATEKECRGPSTYRYGRNGSC